MPVKGLILVDDGVFVDKYNQATDPRHPDFAGGAVGDGVVDDGPALAAADAFAQTAGTALLLPPGLTFTIGSDLALASGLVSAGGTIRPASGVTVTLAGEVWAGLRQVFDLSGGGAVVLSGAAAVLPQWWGAKGDGTADDTDAVTAAIAGAGVNGSVYFPPGTYRTGTLAMLDGQTWKGASKRGSLLKDRDGDKEDYILLADDATVSDLGITGTIQTASGETQSTHFAVRALGRRNAKLVNCWIDRYFWWNAMFADHSVNCGLVDCELDGTVHSHCVEINESSHCFVDRCRIRAGDNGIEIWPLTDAEGTGNRLTHNLIEQCSGGIAVYGGRDTLVENNTIRENLLHGVILSSLQSALPAIVPALRVRVLGNLISRNGTGTDCDGIHLMGAEQCIVSGNSVTHNGNQGIAIYYGSHLVAGNVCTRNWRHGIYLNEGTACTFQGNQCNTNSQGGLQAGSGMFVGGTRHTLIGNTCTDARPVKLQNRGIELFGSDHVVVGNMTQGNVDVYVSLYDGSTGSVLAANQT